MTIQEALSWDKVNDGNLRFLKAIGVDYLTVIPSPEVRDGQDRTAYWKHMQSMAGAHGLKLHNVGCNAWSDIELGSPDRDEKIDAWCMLLRNLGEAGIRTLGYDFKPAGVFRTAPRTGRGGAAYMAFDYEEFMNCPPSFPGKDISAEQLWENLLYFLERVLPVAEEAGVKMALHPDDPPISEPFGGVAQVVSTLEQYHRLFDVLPSHSNGMLFCQGCVAEMGVDVPQAIRDIGSRNRILYVHFRSIRGTPHSFEEVFVDEGDVDMVRAMEAYREVGFEGPFMMDHTPRLPQDEEGRAGRAYAVGYLRALIQAVYGW